MDKIKQSLSNLDPAKQDSAINKGVLSASTFVLKQLLNNVSGIVLKIRTGNLARSLGMRVEKQDGNWVGVVGSGALVVNPRLSPAGDEIATLSIDRGIRMSYADILETGGTIVPKNRQWLAIPLDAAKTPSGVARFTAQQLREGRAPGYEGSVIIGGIIFGLSQTKTRSYMTPLFVLKKSVTIPAKRYLSITSEQSASQVGDIMASAIEKGLKNDT